MNERPKRDSWAWGVGLGGAVSGLYAWVAAVLVWAFVCISVSSAGRLMKPVP